jgi:hypothetical protein
MKPDKLFSELKNTAEKLSIIISEQNFRKTGIKVKSGFCIVKSENHYILDKDLSINKKNELLAEFISGLNYDNIYIIPAVRDFINLNKNIKEVSPESERIK